MQSPRTRSAVLAALLVLAVSPVASADEEMTATRKVGRGLAGLTLGILELPGNMVQEWRAEGPLSSLTVGFVMGLAKVPARTLVGAYELLTAPFPLPAGYEPLMAPDYTWEYFQAEPGVLYGGADRYLSAELADLRQIPGAEVERSGGALWVRFPSDMLFATGSATLGADARTRLSAMAATLNRNPATRIQIQGFTDSTGSDSANLALSTARAQAVRRYLVSQGVDPQRIDTAGYGEAEAVASNETPEGRRRNRRVEFEIRSGGVAAER
jgi:putative exosortase-associated protein (TIGR04073 family)